MALRLPCALALFVLPACVGTGVGVPWVEADPSAVPTTTDEIQTMIFDTTCAPGCHSGGAPAKGLSLEAGASLQNLVGVPSAEVPELLRVAPGSAQESYLIVKIDDFDPRRVGSRMPRTGPPYLSYDQIRALRSWIDAGAAEDWVAGGETTTDSGGSGLGTGTGTEMRRR